MEFRSSERPGQADYSPRVTRRHYRRLCVPRRHEPVWRAEKRRVAEVAGGRLEAEGWRRQAAIPVRLMRTQPGGGGAERIHLSVGPQAGESGPRTPVSVRDPGNVGTLASQGLDASPGESEQRFLGGNAVAAREALGAWVDLTKELVLESSVDQLPGLETKLPKSFRRPSSGRSLRPISWYRGFRTRGSRFCVPAFGHAGFGLSRFGRSGVGRSRSSQSELDVGFRPAR